MKKGILQIPEKIQDAFGNQKKSSEDASSKITTQAISSVAANTKALSSEVVELPAESVSLVEQLRTEIAQGAAFLYVFEKSDASITPAGMMYSIHAGSVDETGYITLANGEPKALSNGPTGGYSIRLPDQIEAAASGHHIIVRTIARASGSTQSQFAVAYSTNEVGNSGWRKFTAGPEWSIHTMEYDVPVMKEGHGDFVGILPDREGNPGTDFCYLAITLTKGIDIQGIFQQKNIMRTIIVSSNCQTGGMAAALQEIFWKDKVLAVPHPNHTNDQMLEHLSNANIWISSNRFDIAQKCLAANPKLVLYKIPELHFPAFHPDLIFAAKISTNEIIKGPSDDYHSAICVWAYKNGLNVSDTAKLFTSKVYYELGYFSMWKSSVGNLSHLFKKCNLDVGLFLPFIIRQGQFMYSINHPKINALIRLAKIIAMKVDANESILEKDINITDGLTFNVWPVYPEIADFYALPGGSYDWKISHKKKICGLNKYIESCFNSYQKQGIERDNIKFHRGSESIYDHVLGSIAGAKK